MVPPLQTVSGVLAIPPAEPITHRGEIVVRAADADCEECRAQIEQFFRLLGSAPAQLGRDLDLRDIPPHGLAVLSENSELALEGLRVAERVPDVRVPRNDSQGLLLATAADQNRDVPGGWRVELAPAVLDDRETVRESIQSLADSAEFVTVLVVVALEPSGACAEDESPRAARSGA